MGDKLLNYLLFSLGQGNQMWSCWWPPESLWGSRWVGDFFLQEEAFAFPCLHPMHSSEARAGALREAGPASAFCVSAETGTCPTGALLCALCSQTLFPGPSFPLLRGFSTGQGPASAHVGAAPELLPSCEISVLFQEWAKACESPEPWCSEALSSATSSSVISGGAHTGTGLQPLPLSSRLRNCCCETPTALLTARRGEHECELPPATTPEAPALGLQVCQIGRAHV